MANSGLFFLALLPPEDISADAHQIKEDLAAKYNTRHAFKSPAHITLQSPFVWQEDNLPFLEEKLREFGANQPPVNIILSGFAAFPPRVIYINVFKTGNLLYLQSQLANFLKNELNIVDEREKNHAFCPHITVAFKDLTKENFHRAWAEYKDKEIQYTFTVSSLTLLRHQQGRWEIENQFNFGGES